jgi:hypothetical protein
MLESSTKFGVYNAIAAIMAELSKTGISKSSENTQQGYKFRGIDQVYQALSPLLSKHKLCVLPRVTERSVAEKVTRNGGTLFYTTLTVEFDFVCAEDGSKHTVVTMGEAMDSGDKSSNKAMSAAYKYACIQAFCIPTEGDNDADATTHEPVSRAKEYADRLLAAFNGEYPGTTEEDVLAAASAALVAIRDELAGDQELFQEAWKLLDAPTRRGIKELMGKK